MEGAQAGVGEKRTQLTQAEQEWLKESKERREKLKLEILASLSRVKKSEEVPSNPRGRRMTLDPTGAGMRDAGLVAEPDVSELPKKDGLRIRFVHALAKRKVDAETKVRQAEEMVKMKEVHEKLRKEQKSLETNLVAARQRNRRMARLLATLQNRLVASSIALQYQLNRKVQLSRKLEYINYYRDTLFENAFAYLYGQLPNEPSSIPLGGIFGPYAYIDYNEEEERVEKEHAYLLSLTPQPFKASAQQRRVSLRVALSHCFQVVSPFVHTNKPTSVEYASLDKLQFYTNEDSIAFIHGSSSSSTLRSSTSSIATGGDSRSSTSEGWDSTSGVVQSALLDSASASNLHSPQSSSHSSSKRSIKALKPSLSDRPTRHEIDQTSPRKPPSGSGGGAGFLGIFKGNK